VIYSKGVLYCVLFRILPTKSHPNEVIRLNHGPRKPAPVTIIGWQLVE